MDWLVPLLAAIGLLGAGVPPPSPPDILLITMDTTRADAVGFSNAVDARTPVLDELAAAGIRYRTAISPAPLTLPSHATILTGLDPPAHGVRSNGAEALDPALPTLASVFAEAGWSTGAVVGSRVLDHRFGLDHGFATYEDTMIAERIGEYGYPERDARAVTDAAVAWLGDRESKAPIFLWVHYYDPHAPYDPPTSIDGATDRAAYLGEVTYVDGQIGRLLSALPNGLARTTVVVVGDHGEALGDHGESTHGIFLYRAVLEVPLMIVGPTLPKGRSVDEAVTLRQLAPTILQLAGLRDNPNARSVPLPLPDNEPDTIYPIFAEATMPRSAYGWAPLDAVLTGGLKYIAAPRPELYDLEADPAESHNLVADRLDDARRLAALLDERANRFAETAPAPRPEIDAETRAALRSLGYVGEAGGRKSDGIDPKDGMGLLIELRAATQLLRNGEAEAATSRLAALTEINPANAPIQTRLGEALLATGQGPRAITAYRTAVDLQPSSEFARRNLGAALLELGHIDDARTAYEEALEIDPRWAPVWLKLAELVSAEDRLALLRRAVSAGTNSTTIHLRLAEIEVETDPHAALETCRLIGEIQSVSAEGALCLGRTYLALDEHLKAASHLRRAAVLGRGTEAGAAAADLLRDATPR